MSNIVKAKLKLKSRVKSLLTTRWSFDEPIVTTDTGELFIGMGETVDAIKISDFVQVDALPVFGIPNKIYVLKSNNQSYYWNGTKFKVIAGKGGVESFPMFSNLPAVGISDTIYVVKTDETFYPTTETSLYVWDDFNDKYLLISRATPTNSFSEIQIDGNPILASNAKDTIKIKAGTGISLTTDINSKTVTVNKTNSVTATINKKTYPFIGGTKGNITNSLGIMSSARINDKVYLMGGYNGSAASNSFQCYNLTTNTCTSIGTVPTISYCLSSFAYNGNIFIAGGYNGTSSLKEFWMYNISTNSWINKPQLNTARHLPFSALIDDKYWVLGGRNGTTPIGTVEYYDFALENWISLDATHNMPTARCGGSTFVFGNLIYCVSGYDSANVYSVKVEVFDTISMTWVTKADMPVNRYGGAGITYNGLGYVFGGTQGASTFTKTLYVYNPNVDKWYLKENMVIARRFACVEEFGNTFYLLGGQVSASTNTVVTEAYSVATEIVNNFATISLLSPSTGVILNTNTGESAKYLGLDGGEVWHYGAWDSNSLKAIITETQS